jgi:hypothetical protein
MGNRRDRERAKQQAVDKQIGHAVDGMMEAIDMHTWAQPTVPRHVGVAWYRTLAERCMARADEREAKGE